jgi:methionine synthase II (cobalamin-independent)
MTDEKKRWVMKKTFQPECLPVLIGSLPLGDHQAAAKLVFEYVPDIPLWVQLPIYPEEGMISQFMPGLPGLTIDRAFVNMKDNGFSDELVAFYEEYMAVLDETRDINASRFVMRPDTARGFFVFMDQMKARKTLPVAVKGQITGPITFSTAVKDQGGKAIFFDEHARDAAVKLLTLKARWQVQKLSRFGCPVILFIDEPALAGFGSSEFISISRDDVKACLGEIIEEVHAGGGLAGIHVCANTEWDLIMDTDADIVNFDAYSYFDRFILYGDAVKRFLDAGKIIAWGIVPTGNIEAIETETPDSLVALWEDQARAIENLGVERSAVFAQTLISPSCGTGSLKLDHAMRVLKMTQAVSRQLRERYLS